MNKQFKVGDQVVRVGATNRPGADLGQRAFVVQVYENGDVRVAYGEVVSECWLANNTAHFSSCKFVPGNTYKDERGRQYKFIAYVPEAHAYERAVFLNEFGSVVLRHEDGDHVSPSSRLDILPNKEMRTICVYKTPGGGYVCQWAVSPVSPLGSVPVDWKKIGEVKEEVEVY